MTHTADDLVRLRRMVLQQLESLRRAGVEQIDRGPDDVEPLAAAAVETAEPEQPESRPSESDRGGENRPAYAGRSDGGKTPAGSNASRQSAVRPPGSSILFPAPAEGSVSADAPLPEPLSREERVAALDELNAKVRQCTLCPLLAQTRTQTVFGVGDPQARLAFFGEAPGADEDRQGEPFVGRAGQLLTDMITKGMKLRREEVYIFNTIKCRPPENRNPLAQEIINCRPYYERQIEIIQPEFIVCLGGVAAQALLDTKTSIGKLRGRLHPYRGVQVLATYHPAYLLRNPSAKRHVWDDLKFLMGEMGLPVP